MTITLSRYTSSIRSLTKTSIAARNAFVLSRMISIPAKLDHPPPNELTFFDLFDLDKSFDIDRANLKRNFIKWQQSVHPDSPSSGPYADAWSQRINEAYSTLDKDSPRAAYLLELVGKGIQETDSISDPELLMSILEAREELQDASTEEEVVQIRKNNSGLISSTVKELSQAFNQDPPDTDAAKQLVIRLRYLDNIETACREWQPGTRVELHH